MLAPASGVVFLVVLALLLGLSVAVYNKVFTPVADGPCRPTRRQPAQEASDVKVRGLLVGEVRKVSAQRQAAPRSDSRSTRTTSTQIPADVTRPAAAQDAVRRAVRGPGPRPPGERATGRRRRDRPGPQLATPSSCRRSSTTRCRCSQTVAAGPLLTLGAAPTRCAAAAIRVRTSPRPQCFGAGRHGADAAPGGHLQARRLRRHLPGAANDLLTSSRQPLGQEHDAGQPVGATEAHVHRRRCLVERDGGFPGDRRAEPHLARQDVTAGARGVREVLADTPACSTG